MFSEVVKLTPQVDRAGLNTMFNDLNKRFSETARKFGEGMKNAFKFGGIIGLVAGLVEKLLNPLEKAEEIINRIIDKGIDATTRAEEFGTTPGKLLRLQGVAAAHGVDDSQVNLLISKFQAALAKEQDAAAAPARIQKQLTGATEPVERTKIQEQINAETDAGRRTVLEKRLNGETDPRQRSLLDLQLKQAKEIAAQGGILHEFLGEKDFATAFFTFVQSLQKLEPAERKVVEDQVFGQRAIGRTLAFFNATDAAEILKRLPSEEKLNADATKTGKLADQRDLLSSILKLNTFDTKANLIGPKEVNAISESKVAQEKSDDETIKRFEQARQLQNRIDKVLNRADKMFTRLSDEVMPSVLSTVDRITSLIDRWDPDGKKSVGAVTGALDVTGTALGAAAFTAVQGANLNFGQGGLDLKEPAGPSAFEDKIDALTSFLQNAWGELKSSRGYRHGGGK